MWSEAGGGSYTQLRGPETKANCGCRVLLDKLNTRALHYSTALSVLKRHVETRECDAEV